MIYQVQCSSYGLFLILQSGLLTWPPQQSCHVCQTVLSISVSGLEHC